MEIEDYSRQLFNARHQAEVHDFAALDTNSKLAHVEEENEQYQQHIEQLEAEITELETTI
jgi:peptidoglycan hydrolase CwlO-like protein